MMERVALTVILNVIAASFLAFANPEIGPVDCHEALKITDREIETVYSVIWAHVEEVKNGWVVVPRSGKAGVPIYHLSMEHGLKQIISPDLRIGINHIQGIAVNPDGWVVMAGYFNPNVYAVNIFATHPKLERYCNWNGLMSKPFFMEDNMLVGGNQHLEIFACDNKDLPLLNSINRRLEKDRFHPIMKESNFHRVHGVRMGNTLALGYTLSDFMDVFEMADGKVRRRKVGHSFKGYQPFPRNWQKGLSAQQDAYQKAMLKGHHLLGLSTDGQSIYGLFRLGFSDDLSFAELWPQKAFLFRNQYSPTQLFAIGQHSTLIGHRHEDTDGKVQLCVVIGPPLSKIKAGP